MRSDQQALNPVETRWGDLLPQTQYKLSVVLLQEAIDFQMKLVGEELDETASNLPVNVQNTVISQTGKLETTAGEQVTLMVEIRTENKNLRSNSWFQDLSADIRLSFSSEQLEYAVSKGNAKGRYQISLTPTRAGENLVSFEIKGSPFNGDVPLLSVAPAGVHKMTSTNRVGGLQAIAPQSVDQDFNSYFMARDRFENIVRIDQSVLASQIQTSLKLGGQEKQLSAKAQSNGLLKVSTLSKLPGPYTLCFPTDCFEFTLTQGAVNPANSSCKLLAGALVAGQKAHIKLTPRDSFDNVLTLSEAPDARVFAKYPSSDAWSDLDVQLDENQQSISARPALTIAGSTQFKCLIAGKPVAFAGSSSADTTHNKNYVLLNSLFSAYSFDNAKFEKLSRQKAFKLDNRNDLPVFSAVIADEFGNTVPEFPQEMEAELEVRLFGDAFTDERPVVLEAQEVVGSELTFRVHADHETRYQNGLFRPAPYELTVNYKGQKDVLPVLLLGNGESDKDAEIEVEQDFSKTAMTPDAIELTAGQSASFIVEVKTTNNKRKADASPSFQFQFSEADGQANGNYQASFRASDLKGTFEVTVTATKATNYVGPTALTVLDGSRAYAQTVRVTVWPDELSQIRMNTEMYQESADNQFRFEISALDRFKNVVDSSEAEVNLEIEWPHASQQFSYQSSEDPKTNSIQYVVDSRIAGEYSISSAIFENSQHSFKFSVVPGKPDKLQSSIEVEPVILNSGDLAFAHIQPFDKYGNSVPVTREDVLQAYQLQGVSPTNATDISLAAIESNNTLQAQWTHKSEGELTIVASIQNGSIPCDTCIQTYFPSKINMAFTRFYVANKQILNFVDLDYASTQLTILCEFFDENQNKVKAFKDDESFSALLTGHNITDLVFDVQTNLNTVQLSLKPENERIFSLLVAAQGYQIIVSHSQRGV